MSFKTPVPEETVFCNNLGNTLPSVTPHIPFFQTVSLKKIKYLEWYYKKSYTLQRTKEAERFLKPHSRTLAQREFIKKIILFFCLWLAVGFCQSPSVLQVNNSGYFGLCLSVYHLEQNTVYKRESFPQITVQTLDFVSV